MEKHVNSTLTRDLSQTISCPWLLLRALPPTPSRPASLRLPPLPLSSNNRSTFFSFSLFFFKTQKSLHSPSISVYGCEHGRVINPTPRISPSLIGMCWPLNFQTKALEAIINIHFFSTEIIVAWRMWVTQTNSNQSFWVPSWNHITWSDIGLITRP